MVLHGRCMVHNRAAQLGGVVPGGVSPEGGALLGGCWLGGPIEVGVYGYPPVCTCHAQTKQCQVRAILALSTRQLHLQQDGPNVHEDRPLHLKMLGPATGAGNPLSLIQSRKLWWYKSCQYLTHAH
eukprot:610178-Pelagomonas_calceolata.AAC.3